MCHVTLQLSRSFDSDVSTKPHHPKRLQKKVYSRVGLRVSFDGLNQWRMNLEEFSEQPNTAIKISGICVPDKKWTVKLNKEIILDVINIFGVIFIPTIYSVILMLQLFFL